MKYFLLLTHMFTTLYIFAQKNLPIIKANSKKAFIIEGEDARYNWNLSPETKPDIHTISKILKPTWIKLYTDIDSIKVKIKPNENFDFIIIFNNKDSCYTRFESPPIKNYSNLRPETHDTIPFILTDNNNIKLKVILNKIDTLNLMFHTATSGLILTRDVIKNKIHKPNASNFLQIGNQTFDSLPIYPTDLSGQTTDGRFGWDLFDGKIIEINYDKNIFIVHTKLTKKIKGYSKFEMEYTHGVFTIQGNLQIKNDKYKNRFLFHTGYQRTIMLDTLLMQEQNFPKDLEVIKKVIMKNGKGKDIPVITVNIEQLNMGKESILNIPVQVMTTENPVGFKIHILGNEVLKRFNTILDFQNNYVYLKPNSLFDLPYKDAK